MFLSVILTIAAAYMALQCGLTAFSVPFASWTWLSWLYLAMAAVMIGVCVGAARAAPCAPTKSRPKKSRKNRPGSWKSCTPNGGRCIWTRTSTSRPRPRRPKPRASAAQAEEAAGADAPDGSADGGESGEAAEEEDGGDD